MATYDDNRHILSMCFYVDYRQYYKAQHYQYVAIQHTDGKTWLSTPTCEVGVLKYRVGAGVTRRSRVSRWLE